MLTQYLTETPRDWDRGETVGASEIGQCARRTAYLKHDTPEDENHEESWGMKERGHWVEKWVVDRLKANSAPVHDTGDDQDTRSYGFLSATPDGWIEGEINISFDVKSFDPRKTTIPEPAHIIQARLGARQNRKTTHALLIYVNASDFEDQLEFGPYPELTDDEYESLLSRARDIMAKPPEEHPREGYFTDECSRFECPFRQRCIGERVPELNGKLTAKQLAELEAIQHRYAKAKDMEKEGERLRKMAQEDVRLLFQAAGTAKVTGAAWISRQTRDSLDTEAMKRDGIDVDAYRREGKPFNTINIRKPKNGTEK